MNVNFKKGILIFVIIFVSSASFTSLVWFRILSGARTEASELRAQIAASLAINNSLEETANRIQSAKDGIEKELGRERKIVTGLRERSDRFEQLYNGFRQNYIEQGRILEAITKGDLDIEGTIGSLERQLSDSLEVLIEIRSEN